MKYPPHCPNPECLRSDRKKCKNRTWYRKRGITYTKRSGPHQRFQCKDCGKVFTNQFFSIDYYAKKKIPYPVLIDHLVSGSGIRDMARSLQCSTGTISNKISRLTRNILAFRTFVSQRIKQSTYETYAADGLESFVCSQYFPNNINILVGKSSQFLYECNYHFFRRKGTMTPRQKRYKEVLYKRALYEEGGAIRSFSELLSGFSSVVESRARDFIVLDTDENPIYTYCIKGDPFLSDRRREGFFIHRQTCSREERTRENPLFSVNYYDREIRKDLAEHRRETVQFARNSNNSMERFTVYTFWHNYLKPYRINKKDRIHETHAEAAGIVMAEIKSLLRKVFKRRWPYSLCCRKLSHFQNRLWTRSILGPWFDGSGLLPSFALR